MNSKSELKRLCAQDPVGMAKKILELEQRVKVLTEAASMAETYLADRVSTRGTVGRTIVLPSLRKALYQPLPKESDSPETDLDEALRRQ